MEEGVEVEEEFASGGEEGELVGFAGGAEVLVAAAQEAAGLADSGEGGEEEDAADFGAAAADPALALAGTALMGVGSEAGEVGDLLAVESAEFRQPAEQGGDRDRADCRTARAGGPSAWPARGCGR